MKWFKPVFFIITVVLLAAVMSACAPDEPLPTPTTPLTATTIPTKTYTSRPPSSTVTETRPPTSTAMMRPTGTLIPTRTATPAAIVFERFTRQLEGNDANVIYRPLFVPKGHTATAIIYLPIEEVGNHGRPFSLTYSVLCEVFRQGVNPYEPGEFTGIQINFPSKDINGSAEEGAIILTWKNPPVSSSIRYVYIFTITPNAGGNPQHIVLAGLPDPAGQVTFEE